MANKPPYVAAHKHPNDDRMIFVMAGYSGYWEADSLGVVDKDLTPKKWNVAHGVTKAEAEAMYAGSMWGWDSPAADPDNYDENGELMVKHRLDD